MRLDHVCLARTRFSAASGIDSLECLENNQARGLLNDAAGTPFLSIRNLWLGLRTRTFDTYE
jgi:hypothetical protein